MKFLVLFAFAFATVTPKDWYSRLIEDPVLDNEGRIVNGQKADPAQFKYMVGLYVKFESGLNWCGASLIGEKWVLSTAHCTNAATLIKVLLGATVRVRPEKSYDVQPKDLYIHPLFNGALALNDISLIQIPATNESSRIGIVKIPKNNNDDFLNRSVVVTGWGRTNENVTGPVDDLHYAILKVSPGELCYQHYRIKFSNDKRLCVATPDKVSTCIGDSGGPLVLEGENIQIGVNSFSGIGCVHKFPVVFTRVSAYRLWIWMHTGIG